MLERVDYYTRMYRIVRTEPLRRTQLLCLRNRQPSEPILPLSSSCTPENSHWLSLLCPNVVQPATLSSRGPWEFSHELQFPETCSDVHFSSANPAGNITITHNLKIIVSLLLPAGEDFRKGTAKRVEVVNNMPVQIISVGICLTHETTNLAYLSHP
jgi:arrestin-related trafficking adapter 3/6